LKAREDVNINARSAHNGTIGGVDGEQNLQKESLMKLNSSMKPMEVYSFGLPMII
jgi:hypothetical protein